MHNSKAKLLSTAHEPSRTNKSDGSLMLSNRYDTNSNSGQPPPFRAVVNVHGYSVQVVLAKTWQINTQLAVLSLFAVAVLSLVALFSFFIINLPDAIVAGLKNLFY